jgi:hypothetical protein
MSGITPADPITKREEGMKKTTWQERGGEKGRERKK